MTGKERAAFRAAANKLDPLFQIGKSGITDAVIAQVEETLNARELIKIKVLRETCPVTPREAADEISAKTGADVIQVIGGIIVLYRFSQELADKKAQKEKNKKEAAKKAKLKYISARDAERKAFGKKRFYK